MGGFRLAGMTMVGGRPAVRGWWLDGGLPHPSPPLWIPAFAGMTKWGAGMTKWVAGMTMVGGRPAVRGWWLDGVLPHPSPPLWIPAFAGMTKWGAGMTKWGAGMTMVGAGLLSVVGGWMGSCLTPHRPSGFRPSPE